MVKMRAPLSCAFSCTMKFICVAANGVMRFSCVASAAHFLFFREGTKMKRTKNIVCILMLVALTLFMMVGCFHLTVLSDPPSDAPGESEGSQPPVGPETQVESNRTKYILNTSSKKYHIPSCYHVKRISQKNYSEYAGTAGALQGMGYTACGTCH